MTSTSSASASSNHSSRRESRAGRRDLVRENTVDSLNLATMVEVDSLDVHFDTHMNVADSDEEWWTRSYNDSMGASNVLHRESDHEMREMTPDDEACFVDSEKSRVDFLGRLPPEIGIHILSMLEGHQDIFTCCLVSRTWRLRAMDAHVWHILFKKRIDDGWDLVTGAESLWHRMHKVNQEGEEDGENCEFEELQPEQMRITVEKKYKTKYVREKERPKWVSRRMRPAFVDGPLLGEGQDKLDETQRIPFQASTIDPYVSTFGDDPDSSLASVYTRGALSDHRSQDLAFFDWHALYLARHELSRRWNLEVEGTKPASLSYPAKARNDINIPGASPPPIESDSEGECDKQEEKATREAFKPRKCYLEGHQDSIYCVRMDTKAFHFPVDALPLSMAAPFYSSELSLGLGSRGKIVSGSRDKTIKIWDGDTGICLSTLSGHQGSVLCLEYDEHNLISGSSDQSIIVWDMTSLGFGKAPEERKRLMGHAAGVLDLDLNESWLVSCSKDTTVRIWHRKEDWKLYSVYRKHEGPVNAGSMARHADGCTRIVTASGEGSIQLWEIETGHTIRTFEGHERGLACVKYQLNTVVTGSNDTTVRVWDAQTGQCLGICVGHTNLVRAIAFDPSRQLILSGGYDHKVKLFSVGTVVHPDAVLEDGGRRMEATMDLRSHKSRVFDVQLDATRIVSCGEDERICVIDFAGQDRLMRLFT